jgi:predicted RecA/RadA family phage recombinase
MTRTILALIALALFAFAVITIAQGHSKSVIEREYYLLPKSQWDAFMDVRNGEIVNYYKGGYHAKDKP